MSHMQQRKSYEKETPAQGRRLELEVHSNSQTHATF
jgi:hypothetical protein